MMPEGLSGSGPQTEGDLNGGSGGTTRSSGTTRNSSGQGRVGSRNVYRPETNLQGRSLYGREWWRRFCRGRSGGQWREKK